MRTNVMLDALMPRVRQKLLAATILHPEKSWYLRELAKFLNMTPSSIQNDLVSLNKTGILNKTASGNRVYFSANQDCPIFTELKTMLLKTVGLVDILKNCLKPLSKKTAVAFVYGSVAAGTESSESDIDLFIVGSVKLAEVATRIRTAEHQLHRSVNPIVLTETEVKTKLNGKNHFIETVRQAEKLFLLGEHSELGKTFSR